MSDDLLARARAYAFEQWPPDHEVDDPFGATGVARSDEYGYDETARSASIQTAEWLLSQLPDREAVARRFFEWDTDEHPEPRPTWEGLSDAQRVVWRTGADAVLDLIRSGADRG